MLCDDGFCLVRNNNVCFYVDYVYDSNIVIVDFQRECSLDKQFISQSYAKDDLFDNVSIKSINCIYASRQYSNIVGTYVVRFRKQNQEKLIEKSMGRNPKRIVDSSDQIDTKITIALHCSTYKLTLTTDTDSKGGGISKERPKTHGPVHHDAQY